MRGCSYSRVLGLSETIIVWKNGVKVLGAYFFNNFCNKILTVIFR